MTTINKSKLTRPSKKDKICAKGRQTYEVSWLYTTNRSGKYEYLYTGKEQGKDYFDNSDTSIKAGDRVIYKNKNHQNNKVEAKVTEIISPLSNVESAMKGISQQKFGKIYKLKFINPPIVNQKQITRLNVNNKMLIEKIPHHKDYICLKKGESLEYKIKNQMKKTFLTQTFYENTGEKQKPFIIEKVLARETNGKKVLDLDKLVEPTNNYIIQKVNYKGFGKVKKSKKYSNSNNEFFRVKAKIHINLKNIDYQYDISNITGFLSCDQHKRRVADIFNSWRNDSYTYITNMTKKDRERKTTKKNNEKAKKIQALVRGHHTRKKRPLLKKAIDRKNKSRKKAAKRIQALVRGHHTRKKRPSSQGYQVLKKRDKKIIDEVMKKRNESKIPELERRLEELKR